MDGEIGLIEHATGRVVLLRGPDSSALQVVNEDGRTLVPLSMDQAQALAAAGPEAQGSLEIERRWLVSAPPPGLAEHPHQRLRQGYLIVDEAASLRIREKGDGSKVTIKRGAGLSRTEVEIDVSEAQALVLWPLAGERIVDKTRYNLPDGDGTLELDVYHGRHNGLLVVEREFASAREAQAYDAPPFAGVEVTEDGRYTNARLAVEGLPS